MTRPLKQLLEVSPDERALRAGWEAIEARLPRSPGRRRARWLALGGAAAAVAIAIVIVVVARSPGDRAIAGGALALADGHPLPTELTADAELSDGSQIAIARGQLELLDSEPAAVRWLLATGTARFAIPPGGPRRWTIDAGVAQVEVVGTVFTVARTPTGIEVSVERGVVVVRGDRVPGLVRRLQAGDALRIPAAITAHAAEPPAPVPAPAPADDLGAPAAPPALPAAPPRDDLATSDAPRAAASTGAGRAAPDQALPAVTPSTAPRGPATAPAGLAPAAPPPAAAEIALDRADDLRRRGDLAGAAAALDQLGDRPGDLLTAIARFTRARILIDLGRRGEAAADLERAIATGLPPALEARARARLAELTHGVPR